MISNTHILLTILPLSFRKKTCFPVTLGPLGLSSSSTGSSQMSHSHTSSLSESTEWHSCHFQPFSHLLFWRQKSQMFGLDPQPSQPCLESPSWPLPRGFQTHPCMETLFQVSEDSLTALPLGLCSAFTHHHLCSTPPGRPACVRLHSLSWFLCPCPGSSHPSTFISPCPSSTRQHPGLFFRFSFLASPVHHRQRIPQSTAALPLPTFRESHLHLDDIRHL